MGKRLIQQRRGKGTSTYKSPSHRYKGALKYRKYDDIEKRGVISGRVVDLFHCSGHSVPLIRVVYEDKEEALLPAAEGVRVNDVIECGSKADIKDANILPLKSIPEGSSVFCIESLPGSGPKFVRTSGGYGKIVSKVDGGVVVKFLSKKLKKFNPDCRAIIGVLSGSGRVDKPFVKAGKKYHAMKARNKLYPRTSGVAMNAVDHPFGSGRGRHPGKSTTAPKNAPPGRNVGLIRARRTGKRK